MKGKDTCKKLKEIRLQIAKANGISYVPTECTHQGPCRGTCPKCEAEVSYLEQQLTLRRRLGKAVAIAGVALSVLHPSEVQAQQSNPQQAALSDTISIDELPVTSLLHEGEQGVVWRGQVVDDSGDGLIGAAVTRDGDKLGLVTNVDGRFAMEVPLGTNILFSFIGCISKKVVVEQENPAIVELEYDNALMGEAVTVGAVCSDRDDVYHHGGW